MIEIMALYRFQTGSSSGTCGSTSLHLAQNFFKRSVMDTSTLPTNYKVCGDANGGFRVFAIQPTHGRHVVQYMVQ